jgi:hypothetical protein
MVVAASGLDVTVRFCSCVSHSVIDLVRRFCVFLGGHDGCDAVAVCLHGFRLSFLKKPLYSFQSRPPYTDGCPSSSRRPTWVENPRRNFAYPMLTLIDLVRAGKARYLGRLEARGPRSSPRLQFAAERRGWTGFVAMHGNYSLLYRRGGARDAPLLPRPPASAWSPTRPSPAASSPARCIVLSETLR